MFFKKKVKESNPLSVVSKKSSREQRPSNQIKPQEEEYEIVEKEILPETMICPDCGGITLVGLDFCDKCGGELINRDI